MVLPKEEKYMCKLILTNCVSVIKIERVEKQVLQASAQSGQERGGNLRTVSENVAFQAERRK